MTDALRRPWETAYPAGLSWRAAFKPETMPEIFLAASKTYAERVAVRFLGRGYTYRQIADMAARFARGLQDLGIGPGHRVGLCLPNTPFYVAAYHGALMAGATVVNFNPLYAEKEIEHQINDSGVDTMVTLNVSQIQPKIEKMLGATPLKRVIHCELADALPPVKAAAFRAVNAVKTLMGRADAPPVKADAAHVPFARLMRCAPDPRPVDVKPGDVALLQYTGGTTGIPKAAVLTHANLTANVRQAQMWFNAGEAPQRMLCVLPFFHVFSMTVQMNLTLSIGGALILLPRFELKSLLSAIEKEKPTIFAGVPTLYKAIASSPDIKSRDLSSLKLCVSGGGPLPSTTAAEVKALTGIEIVEGYGLSETSPLVCANPLAGVKKSQSIGLPFPATDVRIVDLETGLDAAMGAEGEIRVRGPQVMKDYWGKPDETAKVFDDQGFLKTGDVGYMDAQGYIFIVDRIKDMIIASGFKVFPRKVEEAILQNPGVSEVMVAGLRDDYRGETVKAWIVPREGATLDAQNMTAFLKDRLAPYEMPKAFEFRKTLPKTMIGKPDRKALLAEEAAKLAKV